MSIRKIDSYFGPRTSAASESNNDEGSQKKQKTTNTVAEITNLMQSWDVQSDFDSNSSSCDESSTDSDSSLGQPVRQEEINVSTKTLLCQIGPSDITHIASENPTQPILKIYPRTKFGKEWRNFHSEWFKSYPWLEYSVLENSCYCFPCRFFSTDPSGSPFSESGFKNWKKAMDKNSGIKQHDQSASHKLCMSKWEGYKMTGKTNESVLSLINKENITLINENRYYIATVAEILLFTACQNISQRGSDESVESINKGNFLELLSLCAKRDARLQKKLNELPKNAKYTHHNIQNEILSIMSGMVLETIANEVNKSKYFSVLADETKDISKTEQLSVMVRYFYKNTVNERFLGFISCSELNAKALFEFIKTTIVSCGINIQNCIAQTYDGASVMSGNQNGVQAIFKKEVPKALYTHCYNHRLNLVIVDVCKNVPEIEKFITLLQQLYNFVSRSSVHMAFLDLQKKLLPNKNIIELKKLCETRWICQISACAAIRETFSIILVLLNKISMESKCDKSMEAKSILVHINFEFIFCLHLFCDTLSQIKIVSDYLQLSDSDLGTGCVMVESLIDYLRDFRTDDTLFNALLEKAVLFAQNNNIPLPEENICRRSHRKLPARFASYITELPTSENRDIMATNDVKIIIFFPVIDRMINELERRFSDNNPVLSGISSLNPQNKSFLDLEKLLPFAKHYEVDVDSLESELKLIPKLIKRHEMERKTKINSILDFVMLLESYRLAFSELFLLCTIAIVIPPSSAGVERTFSSLRQIKTYMRNKMMSKRLSDLAVLSIEKNISKSLDMEIVVDKFSAVHRNRRIILV